MWKTLTSSLARPLAASFARPAGASSLLPPRLPLLAARALATGPPKTIVQARETPANTSVQEARKVIFGHWPSEGERAVKFRSLQALKGGQAVAAKYKVGTDTSDAGARPKPNLRPPGHSEKHLIDWGTNVFPNNPTNRALNNLERLAGLEFRKKVLGKSKPKKGAGNRKNKKR